MGAFYSWFLLQQLSPFIRTVLEWVEFILGHCCCNTLLIKEEYCNGRTLSHYNSSAHSVTATTANSGLPLPQHTLDHCYQQHTPGPCHHSTHLHGHCYCSTIAINVYWNGSISFLVTPATLIFYYYRSVLEWVEFILCQYCHNKLLINEEICNGNSDGYCYYSTLFVISTIAHSWLLLSQNNLLVSATIAHSKQVLPKCFGMGRYYPWSLLPHHTPNIQCLFE